MEADPELPTVSFITEPRRRETKKKDAKKVLRKTIKRKRKREEEKEHETDHKRFRIAKAEPDPGSVVPAKGFATAISTILEKDIDTEIPILPNAKELDKHIDEERLARRKEISAKRRSKLLSSKDRIVPSFENEDRQLELTLKRIATAGVVKLFNALKKQQKEQAAKQETKIRDPTQAEKLTEERFKSMLAGESDEKTKEVEPEKDVEMEVESSGKPKWGVLQDDFMIGKKFQKWNDDEDGQEEPGQD